MLTSNSGELLNSKNRGYALINKSVTVIIPFQLLSCDLSLILFIATPLSRTVNYKRWKIITHTLQRKLHYAALACMHCTAGSKIKQKLICDCYLAGGTRREL